MFPVRLPYCNFWADIEHFFSEGKGGRALGGATFTNTTGMTVERCISFCDSKNLILAGLEFAVYCDNFLQNGAVTAPLSDCNMACKGNAAETCGAGNRLNVFTSGKTPPPPPKILDKIPTTNLPKPWSYVGCFLTIESSVGLCRANNFTIAAAEFSVNKTVQLVTSSLIHICCSTGSMLYVTDYSRPEYDTTWSYSVCGNQLIAGATAAPESDCNMGCGGNTTEAVCLMSVYSTTKNVTILPVPGCLKYRAIPWQNIYPTNNSATTCLSQCAAFGYTARRNGTWSQSAPESDCNLPCPGDPIHLCGAGNRIQYYTWTGTSHVWHTPANKGHYDVWVVTPLIATVGINNKVTFLEKGGTSVGFFTNCDLDPKLTGAYELDLSLVGNFSAAWREMHVHSDVFCSGSVILPDKAGRQLNVGGWSLESTKGVRLYTPDGSAGVNGTNDWEENFQKLHLQRQRMLKFPVAATVMANETGSNASPQPNLEILPAPAGGDTVIELDWLAARTRTIFILSFLGGRTYPLEGAAVMFPQHAPYTDPVRIMACGGSALGWYRSRQLSANPTWTLERMPSQRVMPCMVPLPDGTFMIMNGAHQGVAALLYDPTLPVNQRISVWHDEHCSHAILLPDARVLVSGSDPQTPGLPEEMRIEAYYPPYLTQGLIQPTFTITNTDWAYGSNHQINVHLFQGQPVSSTHGNSMGSRTIFPLSPAPEHVHDNCASQRVRVPPGWHQFFILDGPTPSRARWVRIGGDPASIGKWPPFPDFKVPGI
ncbi:hypothetical protein C8J57DRAFT_1606424 [Mycena rebaudengoi]|nr:hypothetical protein C8J57DRAFT_1606424 [Mycena rebaudengoi]